MNSPFVGASIPLVGINHRPTEVENGFRKKGSRTKILLRREPGNPYDPNAIAAYSAMELSGDTDYQWHKVGYVPAQMAAQSSMFKSLQTNQVLEAEKITDRAMKLTGGMRTYK